MIKANYEAFTLTFKRPAGTSRGVLTEKKSYLLHIQEGERIGIGECSILEGLSIDNLTYYEKVLGWVCNNIHLGLDTLWEKTMSFPSIQFGLEQAFISLHAKEKEILFPTAFTRGEVGIPINGLIWMGDEVSMREQIKTKLAQGFHCIKMKIGAIDFEIEYRLLKQIRNEFSSEEIMLRVDANGAFSITDALEKLKKLADLDIHSIEQPIAPMYVNELAQLCSQTPLPIALDESLIGVFSKEDKKSLLKTIQPQYIILKPSLIGGYKGAMEWISEAEINQIGWWVTSALESNIGLNALAQWTFTLNNPLPQGLGTGGLYTNNFPSNLYISGDKLFYKGGNF